MTFIQVDPYNIYNVNDIFHIEKIKEDVINKDEIVEWNTKFTKKYAEFKEHYPSLETIDDNLDALQKELKITQFVEAFIGKRPEEKKESIYKVTFKDNSSVEINDNIYNKLINIIDIIVG